MQKTSLSFFQLRYMKEFNLHLGCLKIGVNDESKRDFKEVGDWGWDWDWVWVWVWVWMWVWMWRL